MRRVEGGEAMTRTYEVGETVERTLLVGVDRQGLEWPVEESLAELGRLVQTDGAEVVHTTTQRLDRPVPKTYIGSGKAREIAELVEAMDVDVVVFDDELTPSQQANLERIMGQDTKVIDRTALILDIFGRHATTREGRLQVQLAQNQYLLPRLRGMWSHLVREQTRGGIGSRFGQGESQLEVDRRLVRERITSLRHELARLGSRRELQSKARHGSGIYRVALVGYTNAGKSTLLNALTGSDVYAKDELFATLDPTTRTVVLEEGRKATITDTVGFIQKLPTMLVEAFKSTLAEVMAADLILLVVDASDHNADREVRAVEAVLKEIGASRIPRVLVYNKIDLLDADARRELQARDEGTVLLSALVGDGLAGLRFRIAKEAAAGEVTMSVVLPYSQGMLANMAHEHCQVVSERYEGDGLHATLKAGPHMVALLAPFQMSEE